MSYTVEERKAKLEEVIKICNEYRLSLIQNYVIEMTLKETHRLCTAKNDLQLITNCNFPRGVI